MSLKRVFHYLGFLIYFLALLMVPAAVPAYAEGDPQTLAAFFYSAVGAAVVGAVLRFLCRGAEGPQGRDAFGIVVFGWVVSAVVCAAPFFLTGRAGIVDALFESMSGLTTTGATIFTRIEALPAALLLWRAMTQWLGGVGIVLVVSVVLSFMESQGLDVLRAEAGLISQKITPRLVTTGLVMVRTCLLLTGAQFVLLLLGGMSFFDALCHAMTTLPTGGFSTRDSSVAGFSSLYIEIVIVVFMLIGGTNFFLHYQALKGDILVYFRSVEFRVTVLFLVSTGILLAVSLVLFSRNTDGPTALRQGLFQAISFGTTSGFTTADHSSWPYPARFLLLLTMFVGAMAGSTSGAIKIRRWMMICKVIARELQKVLHPNRIVSVRIEGEVVDESVVRKFVLLVVLWIGFVLAGGGLLLVMDLDAETAFSASASCMSNIGPALGSAAANMAALPVEAKGLLTLLMLVGRLEIFVVIVLLSPVVWRK